MKVLWITANFPPLVGGLEIYTDRAVSSLAAICEVKILTQHGQGPASDSRVGHATVPFLGMCESDERWQEVRRLIAKHIAEFTPHIVHFANAGLAVYRDVVPAGVLTAATVHGNDLTAPWQGVPGREVLPLIVEGLSNCDRVFAVSSHTADLVAKFGVRGDAMVIAAGCDTTYFQPRPAGPVDPEGAALVHSELPMVLTVGRLVPRKGHECILKALGALPIAVHWMIVGEGYAQEWLANAIQESDLYDRVTLAGKVSDEELLHLYQGCSVFVLMPEERRQGDFVDSEGFGLVFQEAGACAKPVIGSDISGCRDAIIDGCTGLLVPPGDFKGLAETIQRVLEERGLGERLGKNALNFLRASGGWERLAAQTLEQYGEMVAEAQKTRT